MKTTFSALLVVLLLAAVPAAAAPGRMLEATPMHDAPAGAKAWRIRYETTDLDGDRAESTGVLVVPEGDAPAGGRDVVAWAHGTVGIAPSCTPLRTLDRIPGLNELLAHGWAVVATNYPGLGTRGPHAYLVGDAAAAAVLDSVRAAHDFSNVQVGRRFIPWGHSQGGHAVLFSAQRAQAYAPELELLGVAAVSPPTDLGRNMQQAEATIRAVLIALTAQSWSNVYGVDLATLADRTTRDVIERATARCDGDPFSAAALLRALRLRARLGGLDLTERAPWDSLIARNSLTALDVPGVPLLLVQSNADKLVTTPVTQAFFEHSCQRGVAARYLLLPDTGHADTAAASAGVAVTWMADRFAGKPAGSDCPSPPPSP